MSEGLSTKDFKILISGLLSRAKSFYTEREYWRVIIWSLQILWDGYYPLYNWDGEEYAIGTPERARAGFPIAERLFAVVWNLRADMDHIGSKWRLEHASAKQMCPWCEANLGGGTTPRTPITQSSTWQKHRGTTSPTMPCGAGPRQ